MPSENLYRWTALALPVVALAISGWLRKRAHDRLPAVPRGAEPLGLRLGRLATGLPLFLSVVAYVISPAAMAWAELPLPPVVRWSGAVLAFSALSLVPWVLLSLGDNVSETVLTRDGQRLVTHGPYRWVRHPLYTVGLAMVFGLALLIANGFTLAMCAVLAAFFRWRVIPAEERALADFFGAEHEAWVRRTGRLLPRLRRSAGARGVG